MTAWSTVPLAVTIMRHGVADFVEKPFDNARLLATVRAQVTEGRKRRRDARLEDDARDVQRRLLSRPLPARRPAMRWASPGASPSASGATPTRWPSCPRAAWPWPSRTSAARARPRRCSWPAPTRPCAISWPRPWPRATVCARLDRALSPRLAPDRFVSLAHAVLDRGPGTMTYTNAGHPPPLLLRDAGTVLRLDRGGPVLGMLEDARYEEAVIPLEPDDRLVLYTDGVAEAAGKRGELGEARLLTELRGMRGLGGERSRPRRPRPGGGVRGRRSAAGRRDGGGRGHPRLRRLPCSRTSATRCASSCAPPATPRWRC